MGTLGVLFVHGIGQQSRGSTLTSWADPLVRWLEGWTEPEWPAIGGVTLEPGGGDLPSAELRFRCEGRDHRWLLAESWWADRITAPSFRVLSRWLTGVAPWTVFAQVFPPLRRQWRVLLEGRRDHGALEALRRLSSVVLHLLFFLAAMPVGLLVLVLVALVGLVLALPLPWGRKPLERFTRALASSLGDSFLLTSSPCQADVMQAQVRRTSSRPAPATTTAAAVPSRGLTGMRLRRTPRSMCWSCRSFQVPEPTAA